MPNNPEQPTPNLEVSAEKKAEMIALQAEIKALKQDYKNILKEKEETSRRQEEAELEKFESFFSA